jgi:type IV pilus assembly protein PilM
MLQNVIEWLTDPPPDLIFEISEAGVSLARCGPKSRLPEKMAYSPLAAGAVEASPIRENVRNADDLDRALQDVMAQAGYGTAGHVRRKDAAVLLPDNCARLTVLDFETLPSDPAERLTLVRWRLKKAVPFDADTAAISYEVQPASGGRAAAGKPISALVAVSPIEVVRQYEAAIQRLGLVPGYVSISVASALNLVTEQGVTMLAKLAGHVLSLVVIDQGQVRLVRSMETAAAEVPSADALTEDRLKEAAADLYPTFVYIADNFGAPVSKLVLAGFGPAFPLAADVFRRELGYEAEALQCLQGAVDPHTAGIWGFLHAN